MKRNQFLIECFHPTHPICQFLFTLPPLFSVFLYWIYFKIFRYVSNAPLFCLNKRTKIKSTHMYLPFGLIHILGIFLSQWIQKDPQLQTGSRSWPDGNHSSSVRTRRYSIFLSVYLYYLRNQTIINRHSFHGGIRGCWSKTNRYHIPCLWQPWYQSGYNPNWTPIS